MTDQNSIKNNTANENDNALKIYGYCLDQIKYYNGIIWQFPTAIAGVNIVAFNYFKNDGIIIFIMSVVNFSLLYLLFRHLSNFKKIVESTRIVEDRLRNDFEKMIPKFSPPLIKSSWQLLLVLVTLNSLLLIYSLFHI